MTTMSAPSTASLRRGGHGHGTDPFGGGRQRCERCRPPRVPVEDDEFDPGQHVSEHRHMAPPLDTRPDERGTRCPTDVRREGPKRHAGGGRGPFRGDRPGVHDRDGHRRDRVVEQQEAVDAGEAERVVGRVSGHPLHPEPVPGAVGRESGQQCRHGVCERRRGSRVHPDLGRQLGAIRQAAERGLGKVEPFGQRRHGRDDVGAGQIAQGRQIRHAGSVGPATFGASGLRLPRAAGSLVLRA